MWILYVDAQAPADWETVSQKLAAAAGVCMTDESEVAIVVVSSQTPKQYNVASSGGLQMCAGALVVTSWRPSRTFG